MQTLLVKTSISCRPIHLVNGRKDIISQAIDVLGRDGAHDLFHNHKGEKTLHRYPLVQYRVHANRLTLFAIGKAVPVLIKVLVDAELDNPGHKINLNNVTMQKGTGEIKPSTRNEYYRLMDWVAFNNITFNEKWKKALRFVDRAALLDNAINGHLKVLGHQFLPQDKVHNIHGDLYMMTNRKTQQLYGNNVIGFNVIFKTPYHLPENFALGRGISLGTGTYQKLRNNPEQPVENIKLRSRKGSINDVVKKSESETLVDLQKSMDDLVI